MYNVTPSMLNAYQSFIDAEITAESDWNIDRNTGEYKTPPALMARRAEKDLIDSINRCPRAPIPAADRGTALNDIVDMKLKRVADTGNGVTYKRLMHNGQQYGVRATINGLSFDFGIDLCRKLASYFIGSMCQHFTEAKMVTPMGDVRLYGYMDYWRGSIIYDLKTTSRYEVGKYAHGWQKVVYPWCALESGDAVTVEHFEYTAVVLREQTMQVGEKEVARMDLGDNTENYTKREPVYAKLLVGTIYPEVYDYNHAAATIALRNMVTRFLEWLEVRRVFITDKKIFGGVNPEGYVGTPVNIEDL